MLQFRIKECDTPQNYSNSFGSGEWRRRTLAGRQLICRVGEKIEQGWHVNHNLQRLHKSLKCYQIIEGKKEGWCLACVIEISCSQQANTFLHNNTCFLELVNLIMPNSLISFLFLSCLNYYFLPQINLDSPIKKIFHIKSNFLKNQTLTHLWRS